MLPTSIFNYDHITVMLTGVTLDPNPAFVGVVLNTIRGPNEAAFAKWTATPGPNGYTIFMRALSGRAVTVNTTATYNVGLEVAQLARREF